MGKKRYRIRPVSKAFTLSLLTVLVIFASITSYSTFTNQRERLLLQCENALQDLFDAYYQKAYSLSDIYVPIFQSDDDKALMRSYFESDDPSSLGYTERRSLVRLLDAMMGRDNDIEFILLFHPTADQHFYLTASGTQLQIYRGALPEKMSAEPGSMRLLAANTWIDPLSGLSRNSFYFEGGAAPAGEAGGILIGYGTSVLDRLLRRYQVLDMADFFLMNEDGLVYDSTGAYENSQINMDWMHSASTVIRDESGQRWYTGKTANAGRVFSAAYRMPWRQLFLRANAYTPYILIILAAFALLSFVLYMLSARHIFHKVERIQEGLDIIGGNRLDYRLSVGRHSDEFDEISEHINQMTELLDNSIQKEYELVKRQTQAELNQIQARFDPHFLYNTLEVVRGKLFRSGDVETADYIEKLSRIFRNLTDAAPVTTIREEIAFCSLYMSLLQLRYQDAVEIFYDIEVDLQESGILAHLIQPAIENYFMHALEENDQEHTLEIICEPFEQDGIRIMIADNGMGSDEERIQEINARLLSPEIHDRGYGLMSIAKRIRLFYGAGWGVRLEPNEPCGMRVLITIPRMSVEAHQERLGIAPTKG